ncbi:hypothetical protein [Jiella marina]|uniref:hypothetical protein n=1 Tax=Jiella sp. LLJ827 TaxID=2917712 RepID=UPI0021006CDD|nr:hypothetical protein [Jiella sp. LLJ827]MCQ0987216.1 hypothetical protein [Jiella sp. LLJ827]
MFRFVVKPIFALIATVMVSSCAIRPLPDPVTRTDTYNISQHIRCESYYALRNFVTELIRVRHPEIARMIATDQLNFKNLDYDKLDNETRRVIERYDQALIAYSFRFEITEFNNLNGELDILHNLTNGIFGLTASANSDHERQNTRSFRVIDEWKSLLTIFDHEICEQLDRPQTENFAYPIAGTIGMAEQIRLFYDMTQSGNLVGAETINPSISDTIVFTTRLGSSLTPRIELVPLSELAKITKASLKGEVKRWDIHQVIVNISLPDEGNKREPTVAELRAIRELNRQEELQFDNDLAREIARELR